jgi:spore germination protein D
MKKGAFLMAKKATLALLFTCFFILLTACSTQDSGSANIEYEETKKMIVDILKTEDGKKALKEVLSDDEFKAQLAIDNTVVTDSIQATLVSDKGKEFWKKAFEDPEFAKSFATSMEEGNQKLMKSLMNDPEYRKKIIELLHDPDLEKELADLLKGNEYREHLKSVISETLESPLYQAKIQEILLKAASEQEKKKEESE